MHKVPIFLIFILACNALLSQDTLLLLNGKQLIVDIKDDSGANVFFSAVKKNGKTKAFEIHKSEIFSITKKGQGESLLYAKDPALGYELRVADMRYYMSGQNDAREGYKSWPTAVGGFAFGAASVFYFEGGFVPFLSPFVYSPVMQIPFIKIKEQTISDRKNTGSEFYVEGYNKTARSKKFVRGMAGTLAGVVAGSLVYELGQ